MAKLIIVPEDVRSRAQYLNGSELPLNYMEDFSLMGFIVNRLAEARNLLAANGFSVQEQQVGITIQIESPLQLTEISSLFTSNNIRSTYADIADTIYQA